MTIAKKIALITGGKIHKEGQDLYLPFASQRHDRAAKSGRWHSWTPRRFSGLIDSLFVQWVI